jgi:hypothetical protein
MYYAQSCFHQMDSFHLYSKQTLYFYFLIQMVYIERQNFFTEFHLQGVKSPHYFSYDSQNVSVPVPHP